jgi:hypothetical protein
MILNAAGVNLTGFFGSGSGESADMEWSLLFQSGRPFSINIWRGFQGLLLISLHKMHSILMTFVGQHVVPIGHIEA